MNEAEENKVGGRIKTSGCTDTEHRKSQRLSSRLSWTYYESGRSWIFLVVEFHAWHVAYPAHKGQKIKCFSSCSSPNRKGNWGGGRVERKKEFSFNRKNGRTRKEHHWVFCFGQQNGPALSSKSEPLTSLPVASSYFLLQDQLAQDSKIINLIPEQLNCRVPCRISLLQLPVTSLL